MVRKCVIVIDLLNDFLDEWDPVRRATLIANTNYLVSAFRRSQQPVIWIRQEFRADLEDAFMEMRDRSIAICIEGTSGAQIHGDLDVRQDDIIVVKKRYSAFHQTGLERHLREFGVSELVICGINTHACVRMTAIDAYQRDFRVTIALDCIASYDETHARLSLEYMRDKIARLSPSTAIMAEITACM